MPPSYPLCSWTVNCIGLQTRQRQRSGTDKTTNRSIFNSWKHYVRKRNPYRGGGEEEEEANKSCTALQKERRQWPKQASATMTAGGELKPWTSSTPGDRLFYDKMLTTHYTWTLKWNEVCEEDNKKRKSYQEIWKGPTRNSWAQTVCGQLTNTDFNNVLNMYHIKKLIN